jgi:hypothetical protein
MCMCPAHRSLDHQDLRSPSLYLYCNCKIIMGIDKQWDVYDVSWVHV